jgi:hypothetical protein
MWQTIEEKTYHQSEATEVKEAFIYSLVLLSFILQH